MHRAVRHLYYLLLATVLLSPSIVCAQSGFYKCEVKGNAPVYQDFPCLEGKNTGIYSTSTKDDLEGLLKHGYYAQAQKYAQEHGITDAQLRAMMGKVARQHEAAENENERIADQRRRQAEYDRQIKEERAIEVEAAAANAQSYYYQTAPAQGSASESEPAEAPRAASPWTPGPPSYDPQHDRWCQADSPTTMHCW
jgi:hypothetical protein